MWNFLLAQILIILWQLAQILSLSIQFGGISTNNIILEFCDFPGNRIRVHAIRHNSLHKSFVKKDYKHPLITILWVNLDMHNQISFSVVNL